MNARSTRREFAFAVASAPVVQHAGASTAKEDQPPITGQAGPDPVEWTKQRYQSAPLRLTFRATTQPETEGWQRQLRAKITDLLGGFPERSPIEPQTLEVRQFPKYRREQILFESRPGVAVVGYLLVPAAGRRHTPSSSPSQATAMPSTTL